MATAPAEVAPNSDQAAGARLHFILRFAVGTTFAFVLCEAMGWYPTFLAPLLAGVLLANLPTALPLKGGLVLILVQAFGAYSAYFIAAFLQETPVVLFATIGLFLFVSFVTLAQGRGFLPILMILISFATIPVITMIAPQQAEALPWAFTRGMIVAIATIWVMQTLWPKRPASTPQPGMATFASPIAIAIAGIAIVLPLMLLYLMYGITDALPVLITTVVLVINFDPGRSAMQGLAMMIGNFIGGLVALVAYHVLQIAPSLLILALISFLIAYTFAVRIERGGPAGSVGLITFNQAMVMFSLALMPGASSSLWGTRLFQFAIACFFAIGMMSLFFQRGRKTEQS